MRNDIDNPPYRINIRVRPELRYRVARTILREYCDMESALECIDDGVIHVEAYDNPARSLDRIRMEDELRAIHIAERIERAGGEVICIERARDNHGNAPLDSSVQQRRN